MKCITFIFACVLQSHWLKRCLHHLHHLCILLKGLAVAVCDGINHKAEKKIMFQCSQCRTLFLSHFCFSVTMVVLPSLIRALLLLLLLCSSEELNTAWFVFSEFSIYLFMDLVHILAASLLAGCSHGGTGVSLTCYENLTAEAISVVSSHFGNIFLNYCSSDPEKPWI